MHEIEERQRQRERERKQRMSDLEDTLKEREREVKERQRVHNAVQSACKPEEEKKQERPVVLVCQWCYRLVKMSEQREVGRQTKKKRRRSEETSTAEAKQAIRRRTETKQVDQRRSQEQIFLTSVDCLVILTSYTRSPRTVYAKKRGATFIFPIAPNKQTKKLRSWYCYRK